MARARQIKREIGAASRNIDREAGQYDSPRSGYLEKCGDLHHHEEKRIGRRAALDGALP
jgi:hypothetical protein